MGESDDIGANGKLLRKTNILLGIIALAAIGFVMYLAQSVLIPFVIAILLSVTMVPLYHWLRKHYVPSPLAFIITVCFFDLVALGLAYLLYLNIHSFVENAPQYKPRIDGLLKSAETWAAGYDIDLSVLKLDDFIGSDTILGFARTTAASVAKFVSSAFLVLLFQVFIMLEATSLRDKIKKNFTSKEAIINTYDAISGQIRKYFVAKTLISLATGAITTIALWILGVDYPVLWGLVTFMLNYIPSIGSIIATLLAGGMAAVQYGITYALLVIAILVVIEFVIGNIIEPRVMGKSLNLSPLVILLALVAWSFLWGPVGAVLAVPMMVFVKAVFSNIDTLKPFAKLMESVSKSEE